MLWEQYPRLFHMAEVGSWPSIRKHGLLSTSALLDLFEINGSERTPIESVHRPESVTIAHPRHGRAIIRDQKPMSDAALVRCLVGMTPRAWYRLVNRRVYFWLIEERLNRLLMAKMYRDVEHVVLTIDTRSLVTACEDEVRLSPINTGSTMRNTQPRGVNTFMRIDDFPFDERRLSRGRSAAIAELSIEHSVPDIARHVLVVERRLGSEIIESVWRR
jgi:hypothetical protein